MGDMTDLKTAEKELEALYQQREKVLPLQRKAVRDSSLAIRQVQVGNLGEAEKMAAGIKAQIDEMEKLVAKWPRLAGQLNTPYQEYAELMVLLSVVKTGKVPSLDVPPEAYLTGTLDAIGELKRVCMELLASGKTAEAVALFKTMEEVYYSMQGYAFPDSIVPGLKAKQDAMKALLERLHSTLAEARAR